MAKQDSQSGLNRTAENIGTGLGHLQAKYDEWLKQRGAIASELRAYMSSAQKMLADLGHTAEVAIADTKAAVTTAVEARKRVISEEHKRKISEAAKARWAAKKDTAVEAVEAVATVKKVRNVSPEVRAKLARLAKARWAKARKAGKTRLG